MVKVLFDTSVLIAAFVASHPKHKSCFNCLKKVKDKAIEGIIGTHALAEIHSVLTRLPITPGISPNLAKRLIKENLAEMVVISLNDKDYLEVIELLVNLNLTGGSIYNALIVQAAIKSSADKIVTLNPNHFKRLGNQISAKVEIPD